jgi:hypothetical protein
MNNRKKWISSRIRMGWMFLAAGVFVMMVGVFSELKFTHPSFNFRIITGTGILLSGIGVGYLVRYTAALKGESSARLVTVEEMDERNVLIRTRAGNRAYWASSILIYIGLMWASFAANGDLPALTGDALWFFLAASVLIPFGVYITNILNEQRKS